MGCGTSRSLSILSVLGGPGPVDLPLLRAAIAAAEGYVDAERDSKGRTALMVAAQLGHVAAVRALLNAGANVRAVDRDRRATPLHYATDSFLEDNAEVMRLLVRAGADVNARTGGGMTPLHFAAFHGHGPAVAYLLSLVVSVYVDLDAVDEEGYTARRWALANGHDKVAAVISSVNKAQFLGNEKGL